MVAFPAGIGDRPGRAEAIVAPYLQPQQQVLPLHFPYVREMEVLIRAWETASDRVWEYLRAGKDVAFACEGDASFYSTFTYLAQTLQRRYQGVEVEVVAGVCSPLAAAAVLGVPLTVRSQSLAILPAIYHLEELEQALAWGDVVVLMKFASIYPQVWQVLQQRGLLERSWVIQEATLPTQQIFTDLGSHPNLKLSYFSILVIENRPDPG